MVTNADFVVGVLKNFSCLNSAEISRFIKRKFNETVSPSGVAGSLRALIANGYAASSRDGDGKTVYWLTDYGKEKLS